MTNIQATMEGWLISGVVDGIRIQGGTMGILIGLGVVCVIWAVVAAILIAADLQRRGMRVNIVWLRWMILKYLHEYARLTREEDGRVGPLFYHYVVPLNLALVIFVLLAIMNFAL
ncbi:MAG TPA: hypothetical protein PK014_04060 [Thermoanaerobaculia bacterium]|nr:hypothetical protein [Thermoanaerobaculia bacterium]HUM29231.1 hypothetical protein [Thermoanaerobaculia bacterium]HXK67810.1 hypothetical protein [Thermoanaerobaculia bacterium]